MNDIGRWRALLRPEDQPLFTKIAYCLWSDSWDISPPNPDSWPVPETLEFFQQLVSNLVQQSVGLVDDNLELPLGGGRLYSLQQYYFQDTKNNSLEADDVIPTIEPSIESKGKIWEKQLDPDGSHEQRPDPTWETIKWTTVLMAGAILGSILLYLCCQ